MVGSLKAVLASAVLAIALAACGGGGGGSSLPATPITPTTSTKATLNAGFSSRGAGASSFRRWVRATTASATLVPTTLLDVPDAYITVANASRGVTQVFAIAYLAATSQTDVIPTTLPSGVWTQSGDPVSTTAFSPGSTFSGIPNVLPDGLAVKNSANGPGVTTFTDTVSGYGTATVTADNLRAFGLATVSSSNDYLNPATYAANGLVWTNADGSASPAASSATADLYMTEDASGHTTLTCAHGCVVGTGTLDALLGKNAPTSLPTTTISTANLVGTNVLIQAGTTDGEVVAFMPTGLGDEHVASNTCGVTAGCTTQVSAMYLKSSGHVFPTTPR